MAHEREHYLAPTGISITDTTQQILSRAEQSAKALGSSVVGTDHLLLGCVEFFAPLFNRYGVRAEDIERDMAFDVEPGRVSPANPPAGKLAADVFAIAGRYAAMGSDLLRPEHLMLALFEKQRLLNEQRADGGLPINLFRFIPAKALSVIELAMRESLRRAR